MTILRKLLTTISILFCWCIAPSIALSQQREHPLLHPDSLPNREVEVVQIMEPEGTIQTDTITVDTPNITADSKEQFTPDPMRAVWYSALMPGLGQIYNRKYWKLPIVIGGYAGLLYGTTWNAGYYADYTDAYRDAVDDDPSTNSYMDFFASSVKEEDLDMDWLATVLKNKKDYYRRNRDLCIISMVGVYLVVMIDAYVDAQLYNFDISPDLSLDIAPSLLDASTTNGVSWGVRGALTF